MNLKDAKAQLAHELVHPYAAQFPLMEDAELQDLAADIGARGLIHPLVRDGAGQLIDGRNRFVACLVAEVEARHTLLPRGADPHDYIYALNVARRHLPPGARAMAAVLANRQMKVLQRRLQKDLADDADTTAASVSRAGIVAEYAPELVAKVLAGGSLTDAYLTHAKPRKDAAETDRGTLERIRHRHPTIHARLVAGEIPERRAILEAEAIEQAELDERIEQERRGRNVKLAAEAFPEKPLPPLPHAEPAEARAETIEHLDTTARSRADVIAALDEEMAFATELLNWKEQLLALVESGIPASGPDWMSPPSAYVTSWAADIIAAVTVLLDGARLATKQGRTLRKVH